MFELDSLIALEWPSEPLVRWSGLKVAHRKFIGQRQVCGSIEPCAIGGTQASRAAARRHWNRAEFVRRHEKTRAVRFDCLVDRGDDEPSIHAREDLTVRCEGGSDQDHFGCVFERGHVARDLNAARRVVIPVQVRGLKRQGLRCRLHQPGCEAVGRFCDDGANGLPTKVTEQHRTHGERPARTHDDATRHCSVAEVGEPPTYTPSSPVITSSPSLVASPMRANGNLPTNTDALPSHT